jgi:ABC-2 type transport system ATP-binding protein
MLRAMLLEVHDLSVHYGTRVAVDGLTLAVDAGEIVGLIGPNGAGKSTALLAIAGALRPSAGSVVIDGVDAGRESLRARAQVGIADQPPTLHEFLTVAELLEFVAAARSSPLEPNLLASLSLQNVANRLCRELSFGYRQRVGLAVALAGGTRVVLLDETLNGLDPHAARAARQVLLSSAQRGAAVLMSTHLLGIAERLCTRIVVLDAGKIRKQLAGAELAQLFARGTGALEELYLSLISADSGTQA